MIVVRWSTQHKTLMFRCQMNPLQASILSQTTITKVLCCYVMLFTSDESCLRVGDYVYTLRRLIFQLTNDGWRTSLPLLDPFKPFHSLIENGVQFLKLDSLSKSFCFKGAMGKMKCTAIYIPYVYQRSLSRLFNGWGKNSNIFIMTI